MSEAIFDIETTGIHPLTSGVTAVGFFFLDSDPCMHGGIEQLLKVLREMKSGYGKY